jgi:transcriptional regulator with XRE-family HTH domain
MRDRLRQPKTPLQRLLREEGRQQRWLAEKIGKDEATVSRIATGRVIPTDDEAAAIAEVLGREVADLFETTLAQAA